MNWIHVFWLAIYLAIILFLFYINSHANANTKYLNDQFVDANERSAQAIANARDWVEQLENKR